jgi:hypothetical protein
MTTTLTRWSGLLLIAGALLFCVGRMLLPPTPMADLPAPATDLLLFVSALLVTLALPGLYARQAHATGTIGLVGHLLLQSGMALVLVYAGGPLFYQSISAPPGESTFAFVLGIALLLGLLLTTIATIRAAVYPRWAGIALVAATVGFLFEFFIVEFLPPVASQISGAFFGLAFALALGWIGASAWRNPAQSSLES